jgi:hypothetical protein
MKRADLEHLIRAAGNIANARELIIIGSQSILGSFPSPPRELTVSMEADMYPLDAPDRADLIDGSIGENSPFHSTFGYYAHGVAPETATLPTNWKSRLVRLQNENTNNIAGLCLSMPDLVVSKLAAGRGKDLEFIQAVFRHGLLKVADLDSVLSELNEVTRASIEPRLKRCAELVDGELDGRVIG